MGHNPRVPQCPSLCPVRTIPERPVSGLEPPHPVLPPSVSPHPRVSCEPCRPPARPGHGACDQPAADRGSRARVSPSPGSPQLSGKLYATPAQVLPHAHTRCTCHTHAHTHTRLTYSATHLGHRLMYAHTPHADPSGSPTAPDTPTTWHCVKGDLHTTSTVGTEPPAGHRDRQQATGQAGPWAGWSLGVLGSRRNSCKRPRPLTSCLKAP